MGFGDDRSCLKKVYRSKTKSKNLILMSRTKSKDFLSMFREILRLRRDLIMFWGDFQCERWCYEAFEEGVKV